MKRIITLINLCIVALLFTQCGNDAQNSIDRPQDTWVFRSVLDLQPRTITLALHDDLWVAYSAANGVFTKAWKGNVNFEGAVYDNAHGPQPTTSGDFWFINSHENPWTVAVGGKNEVPSLSYKGHKFKDGHAVLMYDLGLANGSVIHVEEQPEFVLNGEQLGLERTFSLSDVPSDASVQLKANVSSISLADNIQSSGEMEVVSTTPRKAKGLDGLDAEVALNLSADQPTSLTVFLTKKPLIANPNDKGEETEEIALGLKLINKSDCRTCHNVYKQTVGPAYIEVAKRYNSGDKAMLVNKIINGGAGNWGEAAMTAHEDLPKADVETMVDYILGLDESGEGEGGKEGVSIDPKDYYAADETAQLDKLLPGTLAEVYVFDKINKLDDLSSGKGKLKYGGITPEINAFDADFAGMVPNDDFGIVFTGYLNIEEEGVYYFGLYSDDGSRMFLNGEQIIDNGGEHGAEFKENAVGLKKGLHPFKVEYFESGGGNVIGLYYRTPDREYQPVNTMFLHDPATTDKVAGMSLPFLKEAQIPGDGSALADVHPSFDLTQARPNSFLPKVGGMDFLEDGRLAVSTWDATGSVYLVDNVVSGEPEKMTVKRIASGLAEPLGLKVVDGDIYVLQKQELTKLVDNDGDEMIDEYHTVSNQWKVSANFHEFAFGLVYKDDHFYATLATAILPGGASANPQIPDRGKVVKINAKDGSTEFVAHGLRTPNGIGLGVDDEIFVADNQGDWLPSSKIVHIKKGEWYGSRSVDFEGTAELTEKQPVVWLPQDEIGNSPSEPSIIKEGLYKGHMIHGEVTNGGVKRVFVEKVNGEYQGALFRFIQGLEAGINRMTWGPDGALYVGGIGNPGNWSHSGKEWYGLQRLAMNDNVPFEMLAVRAKTNGVEIEFTEPLAIGQGVNKSDYNVSQWWYKPTEAYGGPKMDETSLPVQSVNISEDRKKVFLEIGGIKEKHVVYIRLGSLVSANHQDLHTTECWYTMNAIPQNDKGFSNPVQPIAANTLSDAEKADGWTLLFDGKTLNGWRNFKKETIGSSWKVEDGAITLSTDKKSDNGWQVADGGDIITDGVYENYELTLEWKIQNCGNSGIIYNVHESDEYDYVWQTGPEMQVLDNVCHPDAKIKTHRAGDLYDMIECKNLTVKPAGEWNQIRLVINNGKTQHWLNGRKVVEFEMFNDEWKTMIANSKFKDMKGFGTYRKGHIALQDHGDKVWYRNIKIKELKGEAM